jgi:hypothetical protein
VTRVVEDLRQGRRTFVKAYDADNDLEDQYESVPTCILGYYPTYVSAVEARLAHDSAWLRRQHEIAGGESKEEPVSPGVHPERVDKPPAESPQTKPDPTPEAPQTTPKATPRKTSTAASAPMHAAPWDSSPRIVTGIGGGVHLGPSRAQPPFRAAAGTHAGAGARGAGGMRGRDRLAGSGAAGVGGGEPSLNSPSASGPRDVSPPPVPGVPAATDAADHGVRGLLAAVEREARTMTAPLHQRIGDLVRDNSRLRSLSETLQKENNELKETIERFERER